MHIITMILLLGLLILIHELGHFGAARILGIKVSRFGFGLPFGPTLYETTWGETKICVHAFLLGGYVSFPDDDPESDLPENDPGRFANKAIWERFMVIIAGVAANAVIAYILVVMVAIFSGSLPSGIYDVLANRIMTGKDIPAAKLDIQKGDKILSVNGTGVTTPYAFIETVQRSKKFDGYVSKEKIEKQISLIKALNPSIANLKETDKLPTTIIKIPEPQPENLISAPKDIVDLQKKFTPEGIRISIAQAKLRNELKDKTEYNSDGNDTLYSLAAATADTAHPIVITIERKGKKIELPTVYPNEEGRIGVMLKSIEINTDVKGIGDVLSKSWNYTLMSTDFILRGLAMIFTGQISILDLHGVVAVTKMGSEIIQKTGIWSGILLTAQISINLAIANLLPIPALDGGHLLFLIIEKIIGRPVDEKIQEMFVKAGFAFLIALMVFIVFNDIFALVMNKI